MNTLQMFFMCMILFIKYVDLQSQLMEVKPFSTQVAYKNVSEACNHDYECAKELICEERGEVKICIAPGGGVKKYNQVCLSSSECDITKGLCCVLQRQHRRGTRKACSYFQDQGICIGEVAMDQIWSKPKNLTSGEKRIP